MSMPQSIMHVDIIKAFDNEELKTILIYLNCIYILIIQDMCQNETSNKVSIWFYNFQFKTHNSKIYYLD